MTELLRSPEHHYAMAASPTTLVPTIKNWDLPDQYKDRFIPLRYLQPHPRMLIQLGLIRLALRGDLDTIIYLGSAEWPATWIAAILARLRGKRVLFWTHGWKQRDRGLKKLFRNTFYRIAHGLLLYGHRAKMIALENGFKHERLYVIYNSLDYDAQVKARSQVTDAQILQTRNALFDHPDRPVVVCSSRLGAGRRFDLLIEALTLLKQQDHHVNLLLVGDGPEKAHLKALADRADLPVHFYGSCYDEQTLARLIMAANVTVAPGDIGLTAMHSLAFGVPVITHDEADRQGPEWEVIVPGKTGDLFKRDDVADLARVLKRWTQTPLPPTDHRNACHQAVERFYTPQFQRIAIDRAVRGDPADDLFWMKQTCAPAGAPNGSSDPN